MKKTKKKVSTKPKAVKTKAKPKGAAKAKPVSKPKGNTIGVMPMGDRVLVKPISPEELQTSNSFGLIIPDSVAKEKAEQGMVVAVGPGKRGDDNELIPVAVSVGDKVMFSKYGFDEIKIDGVEYYILPESSILAILSN